MPITQARMMTMIRCARDYQQALQHAEQLVASAAARASSPGEPSNALQELLALRATLREAALLRDPLNTHTTIQQEDTHFQKKHGENEANRKRMIEIRTGTRVVLEENKRKFVARLKQDKGAYSYEIENAPPPQSTAPSSISRSSGPNGLSIAEAAEGKVQAPPIKELPQGLMNERDKEKADAEVAEALREIEAAEELAALRARIAAGGESKEVAALQEEAGAMPSIELPGDDDPLGY